MIGLKFTGKVDTEAAKKATQNLKKQLKIRNQALRQIGQAEIKTAQKRISQTKTDPAGQRWAPWSYATIKSRRNATIKSRSLLYRTGNLLRSFTTMIQNHKLIIKNKASYSSYLQFGTARMKARAFLGWSKQSIREADKVMTNWIKRGWK